MITSVPGNDLQSLSKIVLEALANLTSNVVAHRGAMNTMFDISTLRSISGMYLDVRVCEF